MAVEEATGLAQAYFSEQYGIDAAIIGVSYERGGGFVSKKLGGVSLILNY
jgi:hypothetical protein